MSRRSAAEPLVAHGSLAEAAGRTYVSLSASRESPRLIVGDRARALSALCDGIIPGDEHWPPASATDVVGYIDAVLARVPDLAGRLLDALDEVDLLSREDTGRGLHELDADGLERVLVRFERSQPLFRAFVELCYEAYYRDPAVVEALRERTGFRVELPLSGAALPPFDESRLDRVRVLPPRYREDPR